MEIFGGVQNKEGERTPNGLGTYRHGQYKNCKTDGSFGASNADGAMSDDHHMPLNPDSYLHLRVEPMVRFYQQRLPQYHRSRSLTEVLLILVSPPRGEHSRHQPPRHSHRSMLTSSGSFRARYPAWSCRSSTWIRGWRSSQPSPSPSQLGSSST